jgi:zinc/manganese transport system permease protein
LLLLGLLAAPAGAAQRLTDRPYRALWLSASLSVASVWLGLAVSYAAPSLPPSFAIMSVATAGYVLAHLLTTLPTLTSARHRSIHGGLPAGHQH